MIAGFEHKTQLLTFLDKNEIVEKYFPDGIRTTDVGSIPTIVLIILISFIWP